MNRVSIVSAFVAAMAIGTTLAVLDRPSPNSVAEVEVGLIQCDPCAEPLTVEELRLFVSAFN